MPDKGLFLQNVIAVVWDFDKTLSSHYMQRPLFEAYDIDENTFWNEVNALPAYYKRAGITVSPETSYLGHMLSYVQAGRMKGLTNAKLRELGRDIALYPGLPDFLLELKQIINAQPFKDADLRLEHYVVSTGLKEMVLGSRLAPYLEEVWASEFIETPAAPGDDLGKAPAPGTISQIAGFLDHTTKTRALFEINKGVNKHDRITVNTPLPEDERRVPFRNLIYIADGPSDIPSFSVVKKFGGFAFAVYENTDAHFKQVRRLHQEGRVHEYGEADYRQGTQTWRTLTQQVRDIADSMVDERRKTTEGKAGVDPTHIRDE